jgi:hypothetical protein
VGDLRDRGQVQINRERGDGAQRTQDQDDYQVVALGWVQGMLFLKGCPF